MHTHIRAGTLIQIHACNFTTIDNSERPSLQILKIDEIIIGISRNHYRNLAVDGTSAIAA